MTKNVNFEISAHDPRPFLQNEGLNSPIRESGIFAYFGSLKMLPIDFSFQKTRRAKYSGMRDAVCGIIRTTKLATKLWKRNFEFLPQKICRAFRSQIFFLNVF